VLHICFSGSSQAMRNSPRSFFFLGIGSILCSCILLISTAEASPQINVMVTGDSITGIYHQYYPISDSVNYFADTGCVVNFQDIALGGMKTGQYAGYVPWDSNPLHDYAQDVADAKPDYIVFMLGTNDVFNTADGWTNFQTYIPKIFDHWKNGPKVIVASIMPQIYIPANNQQLNDLYNPFLKQQAALFGFSFLDTNALIQENANWESYYATDGIHPNPLIGAPWIAKTVCDAVKADILLTNVPEPASLSILATGALCMLGYLWRRKRAA
jgi:hypothetical protein